jgi:hypothetical protein
MWMTGGSFDAYLAEYLDVLSPLFEPPEDVVGLFEYLCCLLHPSGVQGLDENPLLESIALIDDLTVFSRQDLPVQDFEHPDRTRARLALLSYCHLTEADFFSELLINLLRVRCGEQWALAPFNDLVQVTKAKSGGTEKRVQPSPSKKIKRINEYATSAGMPGVTAAFKDIYLPQVRNAVFHADYTITDHDFHMMRDQYHSPHGYLTRDVPLTELLTIVDRTFAFYYALLNRHHLATARFGHLKNKAIPFDVALKGLIEFLFEDDVICGFHMYWPNRQSAEFTRRTTGCHAINLWPNVQGGLNIEVGMYATKPGRFSPLVEKGEQPAYSPTTGRTITPYWPSDLVPIFVE